MGFDYVMNHTLSYQFLIHRKNTFIKKYFASMMMTKVGEKEFFKILPFDPQAKYHSQYGHLG